MAHNLLNPAWESSWDVQESGALPSYLVEQSLTEADQQAFQHTLGSSGITVPATKLAGPWVDKQIYAQHQQTSPGIPRNLARDSATVFQCGPQAPGWTDAFGPYPLLRLGQQLVLVVVVCQKQKGSTGLPLAFKLGSDDISHLSNRGGTWAAGYNGSVVILRNPLGQEHLVVRLYRQCSKDWWHHVTHFRAKGDECNSFWRCKLDNGRWMSEGSSLCPVRPSFVISGLLSRLLILCLAADKTLCRHLRCAFVPQSAPASC